MGQAWWQAWIKQLVDCGLLVFVTKSFSRGDGSYQVLELTSKGRAYLGAGEGAQLDSMVASQELVNAEAATQREQQLAAQRAEQAEHTRQVREQERQEARAKEERLLQALMSVRAAEADRVGAKAYQVADEPQLRALVRARPSTLGAFREAGLEGWGEAKVRNHGQAFVDAIVAACQELGLVMDVSQLRPYSSSAAAAAPSMVAVVREVKWTDALAQTYAAFTQEKRAIHAIANERPKPIKEATVRSYLAQAAQTGRAVDWDRLAFPTGLVPAVLRAMEQLLARQEQQAGAGAGGGEGGGQGPAALATRDIQRVVPDYWHGQEASWGDVEAARVCLLQRHWHVTFDPTGTGGGGGFGGAPAAAAAAAAPAAGGGPPVGAWLTTRKRPLGVAAAAANGGGGGAMKIHQPAYLSRGANGAAPAAAAAAAAPAAAASTKLYVPGYAAATPSSKSNTSIISPPPAPAAAAAVTPKQAPTTQALMAALGESPQGLTMAELEARLGPVGPCLAALQEECVVYEKQGRFLLL